MNGRKTLPAVVDICVEIAVVTASMFSVCTAAEKVKENIELASIIVLAASFARNVAPDTMLSMFSSERNSTPGNTSYPREFLYIQDLKMFILYQ